MSIELQRIRPEDATSLRELRLAALSDRPDAFGSTFERELEFADDIWAARAAAGASGDETATFLAWSGESPVGIVGGLRDREMVELISMWIAPEARRQGLGRRLVDAVLEWARGVGARRVELWVTTGNDSAQRLYESLGFGVTGDVQPLPSDPCRDETRMVHHLGRRPPPVPGDHR